MKVNFVYVRHGETLFNVTGRFQGKCDSPLTENGIAQAEDSASALCRLAVTRCYVSPLERAIDTAQILCRRNGIVPREHAGLIEFDFGELDGERFDNVRDIVQGHGGDWSDVGGESEEEYRNRMNAFFQDVLEESSDGDTVMIVGHGSWYRHMENELFDGRGGRLPNAGIFFFAYEDGIWTRTGGPYTADEYRALQKKHVTFYYVRHGITVFNEKHRMQGRAGGPLSKTGKQQAYAAKEALKNVPFTKAYTSTAFRARETMAILLEGRALRPVRDKRLQEVFFGQLEGEHYPDVRDEVEARHITEEWKDIGGESREEIHARIASFFKEAADSADDGDTILCTAHGILYMNILEVLFGISRQDAYEEARKRNAVPMPGCGIFRFAYEDGQFRFTQFMQRPEDWRNDE